MDKALKLLDLLRGSGVEDVVIPRGRFIEEHKKLIDLLKHSTDKKLQKEGKSQEKELQEVVKGGSKASSFIAKIVKKPSKFAYTKLANPSQSGFNQAIYGASPSIQKSHGILNPVEAPRNRKTTQQYKDELFELLGMPERIGRKNLPAKYGRNRDQIANTIVLIKRGREKGKLVSEIKLPNYGKPVRQQLKRKTIDLAMEDYEKAKDSGSRKKVKKALAELDSLEID